MDRKRFGSKALVSTIGLMMIFLLAATGAWAQPADNGAKTAPPPISDSVERYVPTKSLGTLGSALPNSAWDPNHKYLFNGSAGIGNNGNGEIYIQGNTNATQICDSVGIRLHLEKWTGSYWVEVYHTSDMIDLDTVSKAYADYVTNSETGYYYRTVADHWVTQSGAVESGTTYGSYKLIN